MSWQASMFTLIAVVLIVGVVWFERSRPSARIIAAVAALAALGVAGRVALAPVPNLVATTDIVLITGYVLGGAAGFAVGALSALISNIWLGQGPWTPWQMAGWGLVGVGGAALAMLTGRRLGRWGLAAAAAVAGLAYGAFLDLSSMVSFGGEQSVDRYVALSARAIPFNIVHAVGNAALMLAAGPALIRIVDRYRDRSEVEWGPRPQPSRALGGGAACLLVALGLGAGLLGGARPLAAEPAQAEEVVAASAGEGLRWMRSAQNGDGGFGISPGSSSNAGMTGWAVLGLEAMGRNPRDVRKGGRSPVDFLRANVKDIDSTGDLERTILALRGAGLRVTNFGGRNLLAELRSRQRGNGSYEQQVNLTSFSILARGAAGDGKSSLRKSAAWLRKVQNKNGGWGSVPTNPSEPDSTGAAIQALVYMGSDKAVKRGRRWLVRSQNGDGGWSLVKGSGSNAQSTAWAVQGLIASGANPGSVAKRSRTGLDYLKSRQASDGHYRYSKSSDQTPVWVTAQALTALAGKPFPIEPVPRAKKRKQRGGGNDHGGATGPGSGPGPAGPGGPGKPGKRKPGPGKAPAVPGAPGTGPVAEAEEATGDELEVLGESAATGTVMGDPGESPLPATPVFLGGLGALGAGLVGGWFIYRRRLP